MQTKYSTGGPILARLEETRMFHLKREKRGDGGIPLEKLSHFN